jgi:uncharacterized protein YpbB
MFAVLRLMEAAKREKVGTLSLIGEQFSNLLLYQMKILLVNDERTEKEGVRIISV